MRSLVSLALLALPAVAAAFPMQFTHQGRLMDSAGDPLDGPHDLTLSLYDAPATGAQVWTETYSALEFTDGYFSVRMGEDPLNPIDVATVDMPEVHLALAVDGSPELPTRQMLVSVPYAILATESERAYAVDFADVENVPGDLDDGDDDTLAGLTCANTEILRSDGIDWLCAAENDHNHDAAQTTSGVFDIGRLPVGASATDVAPGDHVHGFGQITGIAAFAQLPVGTGSAEVSAGNHAHDGAAITSGTVDVAYLPVGTTAADVAAGAHAHDGADITAGTVGFAYLPVGTTASDVAAGAHAHDGADISGDLVIGDLVTTGVVNAGDVNVTGTLDVSGGTFNAGSGGITASNVPTGDVHTLRVRGTGLNWGGSLARNALVDGVDQVGNARGLSVTVITRATGAVVGTTNYDTHGTAADVTQMVTDLNALDESSVVLIASYDAWTTALTTAAKDALARVGASNMVYNLKGTCCGDTDSDSRSSYALIGIPGRGLGSGIEGMRPSGSGVVELAALMIDGDLVGEGRKDACPPGWYDIGDSCIEHLGAGDNRSWNYTANRCYDLRAHMCGPYEMYTAIRLYGATLDIGPGLSHPHIDQLAKGQNETWGDWIVMQGWGTATSTYGNWAPTTQNGNSRAICCVDK